MKEIKLGRVIAERALSLKRPGHPKSKVLIRIGEPRRSGPKGYRCPYQIKGNGYDKIRGGFGVDALHALLLTINLIGQLLGDHPRADGSTYKWVGWSDARDCGFPVIYWRLTPAERRFRQTIGKQMRKQSREKMRQWKKEQKKAEQQRQDKLLTERNRIHY